MEFWIRFILWILTGGYLIRAAWADRRSRTIPSRMIAVFGVLACGGRILLLLGQGKSAFPDFILSLLPGACVLMLGFVTRQSVGYGDGLSLLIGGIAVGASSICAISLSAFALCAIWGIGKIILKKASSGAEIAFLPFVTVGYFLELAGILLERI